jgi:hypothetical protein
MTETVSRLISTAMMLIPALIREPQKSAETKSTTIVTGLLMNSLAFQMMMEMGFMSLCVI